MTDETTASAMARRDLRAMNSDVTLIAGAADAARRLDRAERWLAAYEARFSRFLPASELTRLNTAAGRPFRASPRLFALVSLALALARRSGGLFDPTVLHRLEDAGYDRSFELLAGNASSPRPARAPNGSWRDLRLDAGARTIELPAGLGIDLGGIGKGWAVDQLVAMIGRPGLVDGGGDVFAAGSPTDGPAWRVGVADPFQSERDLRLLRLVDRGVATSSSLKRRWTAGGAVLHHLIDPRTGRPSTSDAVQVTAIASSTLLADYHAKVALLLGARRGLEYLNREPAVEGIIVRADGSVIESRGLAAYLA